MYNFEYEIVILRVQLDREVIRNVSTISHLEATSLNSAGSYTNSKRNYSTPKKKEEGEVNVVEFSPRTWGHTHVKQFIQVTSCVSLFIFCMSENVDCMSVDVDCCSALRPSSIESPYPPIPSPSTVVQ